VKIDEGTTKIKTDNQMYRVPANQFSPSAGCMSLWGLILLVEISGLEIKIVFSGEILCSPDPL